MTDLILVLLASIGLTHIVVDGKIFEPVRKLAGKYLHENIAYIFSCYQCCGIYTSASVAWINYGNDLSKIILCAFAGSVLSNFMAIFMNFLEASTFINMPTDERK